MNDHCEHCPVAPGNRCARLCEDAAKNDPAILRHIVGRSAYLDCEPAPQQATGSAPRVPVAQSLAIIARMRACPFWEASSSCGCGNNICKSGKGRNGVVSHADCRACLESGDGSDGGQE